MSSVDSIFNSVSTLWSIDIYKKRIRPDATDAEVVATGFRNDRRWMVVGDDGQIHYRDERIDTDSSCCSANTRSSSSRAFATHGGSYSCESSR